MRIALCCGKALGGDRRAFWLTWRGFLSIHADPCLFVACIVCVAARTRACVHLWACVRACACGRPSPSGPVPLREGVRGCGFFV